MNVLEKILEEIDNRKSYHEELLYQRDGYEIQKMYCDEELNWIANIIRSHMDEVENDGWIPVEERLPEEKVLAQDKYGEMLIGYIAYDSDNEWFECEDEGVYLTNVVAWQPLPEPYKVKEK